MILASTKTISDELLLWETTSRWDDLKTKSSYVKNRINWNIRPCMKNISRWNRLTQEFVIPHPQFANALKLIRYTYTYGPLWPIKSNNLRVSSKFHKVNKPWANRSIDASAWSPIPSPSLSLRLMRIEKHNLCIVIHKFLLEIVFIRDKSQMGWPIKT